ncbi:uncharacterized protein BXZ73DRAFT_83187 [Epithele typhae]|uniref:uncharacterized protein n=1 Tax=Epithele typhae TaxID=378194 RepID=UPI00200876BA|nr:uncharacterized protein BXZ73DRAFT_83187 [Epithele typhae]KAH9910799.1 hypothetical protein BXZ73DRAFT_83187 [Epithele typhae]
MLSLLSLPNELLCMVFALLDGQNAFSLSHTAKRLYFLHVPDAFRSLTVDIPEKPPSTGLQVLALSEVLSTSGPLLELRRGRYVRRLKLCGLTDPDLAHISRLFAATERLERLYFDDLGHFQSPQCGLVPLGAMGRLEQVVFLGTGPWAVQQLPMVLAAPNLTSLCFEITDSWFRGITIDVAALVTALSCTPRLRTLRFRSDEAGPAIPGPYPSVTIPSVRELSLRCLPSIAAVLVDACANVKACRLQLQWCGPPAALVMPTHGSLGPLHLAEFRISGCIGVPAESAKRLGEVPLVSLGEVCFPLVKTNDARLLAPLVRTTRPIALGVFTAGVLNDPEPARWSAPTLAGNSDDARQMWAFLLQGNPRLRSLEITVTEGKCKPVIYKSALLDALRSTALEHLNLFFLAGCGHPVGWGEGCPERERKFLEAVASFPEEFATSLPTLRAIAMSWPRAGAADFTHRKDWEEDAKYGPMRVERWWRVDSVGTRRTAVEIGREEGNRLRELIQRGGTH